MAAVQDISCANCFCTKSVMKRCTGCRQVYYCSRECQKRHWLGHKSECHKSSALLPCLDKSILDETCREDKSTAERAIRCAGFSDRSNGNIPASLSSEVPGTRSLERPCGETCVLASHDEIGDIGEPENRSSAVRNPGLKPEKCQLVKQEQEEASQGCSDETAPAPPSQINCYADAEPGNSSIAIFIKHNKTKHSLDIPAHCAAEGNLIWQHISDFLHIPETKLKLIHKGRMVTQATIKSLTSQRALFQALGEVAESEEGLEKNDIEVIRQQTSVERNEAIRALRKSGGVVDAIIDLGNQ